MASTVSTPARRSAQAGAAGRAGHRLRLPIALGVSLLLLVAPVWSQQPTPDGKSYSFKPDACRSVVSRFEETITFLRQQQGAKAAEELKEKLLPAKVEREILFRDGYCGLANYLRDKRLDR